MTCRLSALWRSPARCVQCRGKLAGLVVGVLDRDPEESPPVRRPLERGAGTDQTRSSDDGAVGGTLDQFVSRLGRFPDSGPGDVGRHHPGGDSHRPRGLGGSTLRQGHRKRPCDDGEPGTRPSRSATYHSRSATYVVRIVRLWSGRIVRLLDIGGRDVSLGTAMAFDLIRWMGCRASRRSATLGTRIAPPPVRRGAGTPLN
jgi:hypothetical protein